MLMCPVYIIISLKTIKYNIYLYYYYLVIVTLVLFEQNVVLNKLDNFGKNDKSLDSNYFE